MDSRNRSHGEARDFPDYPVSCKTAGQRTSDRQVEPAGAGVATDAELGAGLGMGQQAAVLGRLRSWLQFVEGVLQVLGGDAARIGERARRQGVMGDAVDQPRQPAGGVEQRLCGGRLEQRHFAAGQAQ